MKKALYTLAVALGLRRDGRTRTGDVSDATDHPGGSLRGRWHDRRRRSSHGRSYEPHTRAAARGRERDRGRRHRWRHPGLQAEPDGYTILMGNLGTQAASVGLYPKLAYDPRTDFEPIMNSASTPMLVVAKKDLPVKDFKEFVAYLKANAPKMNYGSGGVGSPRT